MAAAMANRQLNVEESPLLGSRNVDCFEKLEQIGEGTYGQVYMAREKETGEIVGLKKIRMDKEKESTEYIDFQCYMKQLLMGLHYCHANQVLHRDIKGSNLLIDNEGNLKLADFGLARYFSSDVKINYTNRVITLWYRPPELLLGATKYGPAVDMWSAGCIFAELLHGKPILQGKNEIFEDTDPYLRKTLGKFEWKRKTITEEFLYITKNTLSNLPTYHISFFAVLVSPNEQLDRIYDLCGTPDEETWPGVSKFPWYYRFKPMRQRKKRIHELFRHFDQHALDLLEKMLALDPAQRISAKDALDDEYFWCDPLPCDPKSLPKYESSHEFQTKRKKLQQLRNNEMPKRPDLSRPPPYVPLPRPR
ncbi:hypothetical protein BUALT_Bualt04G0023000 [Buddleja alternifolia]|uniref:Protein kinase domain-containing protein n=1 Tax=Buddleja alternifolia TaxID=168488 RepID=A0AAV6XM08_9LAMI|nr:hypothetical protein BUALT_Bualt04G0023000 [Buddleja alternifolia]